ncbi:cupin domain-containing protein [Actinomadura barringtoniae]|uniref:Cupin domain-containing protein n=1 Tax=Actinomadura barringtoniae TaxID=1427535 RepID=A0A939PKH8_9ACTN|nr:cupin domain-containing protein [Actinomadura barringtoniae]MBO2454451.1 cupin domain-containing protein [Actinomadura barringtoniae]
MEIVDAGRFEPAPDGAPQYLEQLRVPALSVGTYSIPAGTIDDQSPHSEDEIYVVVSGRGSFTSGGRTVDVGPGITLFVPAHEEHRFHDVTEDMTVLVFFAPAYTGSGPSQAAHT